MDILLYGGFQGHERYVIYLPHALYLVADYERHKVRTTDLLSRIAACQKDLGDYSSAERANQEVIAWPHIGERNKKTL